MELNFEIVTTPPADAASVLLLRDSPQGLQVLLLRRAQASQVLGGAYVFPGGKVDAQDHSPPALRWLSQSPEQLRQRLCEPLLSAERAAGLFMAALREVCEECGVLVGQGPHSRALAQQLHPSAAAAPRRSTHWHDTLSQTAPTLRTEHLWPWSRWITPLRPAVTNKRFDTRFFLAQVDADQCAQHDNHETTDSRWLTPQQALQSYAQGEIELVAPQIMSLYQLKAHRSVTQALSEAQQRPPALIEPHHIDQGDHRVLCYPGDALHPVPTPAMRGPTRLLLIKGRFVPEHGMAQLLD